MRKPALYSRSAAAAPPEAASAPEPPAQASAAEPVRWRQALARAAVNPRVMWAALVLLAVLLAASQWQQQRNAPPTSRAG